MKTDVYEILKETLEDSILRCKSKGLDPNKYSTVLKAKVILNRLENEKHFCDLTKEEQQSRNEFDLKEMKMYYGSWDELREVIKRLEDNENEADYERAQTGDAWAGGIAENH